MLHLNVTLIKACIEWQATDPHKFDRTFWDNSACHIKYHAYDTRVKPDTFNFTLLHRFTEKSNRWTFTIQKFVCNWDYHKTHVKPQFGSSFQITKYHKKCITVKLRDNKEWITDIKKSWKSIKAVNKLLDMFFLNLLRSIS